MWARVHNRCRKGKMRMYCLTFLIWWLWTLEEHKDLENGLWVNQAYVQHVILPEEIPAEKSSYSWSMHIIVVLKLSIGFLYNEQCFTLCFLVSIPKCHSHVWSDVEWCWSSQVWNNLKKTKWILIHGAVTVSKSFQSYVPSFGSGPAFRQLLQDGQFPTSTDDLQLVLPTSCSPLSAVTLSKRNLCRCLRWPQEDKFPRNFL